MSYTIVLTHDDASTTNVPVDRSIVNKINAAFIQGSITPASFAALMLNEVPTSPISTVLIEDVAASYTNSISVADDQSTFDVKFDELSGKLYNILK